MKKNLKHVLLFTNVIICAVIIVGFFLISMINQKEQNELLSQHIESISNLASLNIHSQIVNTFSESVHVSQTMSKDTFLIDWLKNEGKSPNAHQISEVTNYLNAYKSKNNYNTAFLVSQNTLNYYGYDRINKVIGQGDQHDIWFPDFVKSGEDYRLEIDYDQTNANEITMFVNCRVEDENNKFMGVVGVGLQIDKIQNLLMTYEKDYNLKAYLVDKTGKIMIRSDEDTVIADNYFDDISNRPMASKIFNNQISPEIQWVNAKSFEKCVISQYIKDFNWYLIIEKDNREIEAAFSKQFRNSFFIFAAITIIILLLITGIVKKYNDIVRKITTIDQLTNLPNREAFYSHFEKIRQKSEYKNGTLFILDIDNFKHINDEHGHTYGDEILAYVAKTISQYCRDKGMLARWGGDEFIGVLKQNSENKAMIQRIIEHLLKDVNSFNRPISISVGMANITEQLDIKELVVAADKAMYEAKANGKGTVY